jgi:TRAP-type C4-dicarboxylate transport system permease small subunit
MTYESLDSEGLPQGLAVFRRVLGYVGVVELVIAVGCFTAAVMLNSIQIFLRYAFETSIWWAQEISLLWMMFAYFIGVSCVFRLRHYVVIDFFFNRFSPRNQLFLYFIAQVLTVVFCAVVLVQVFNTRSDLLTTYTVILHLPEFYWALPLFVASVSMILTSIYYTLAVWSVYRRQPSAELIDLEREINVHPKLALR